MYYVTKCPFMLFVHVAIANCKVALRVVSALDINLWPLYVNLSEKRINAPPHD